MTPARLLVFTPVPLRARCDGWNAALQLRFVELLAAGAKPGEAAGALGKNRQNSYALRRRPGAESFAAAWDAAAAQGALIRAARKPPPTRRVSAQIPQGSHAEAIAATGQQEIAAAATRDDARAALSRMLDGLYPGTIAKNDKSDKVSAELSSLGGPNFPQLAPQTVAFHRAPLRRVPC